jgi:hypothetical protein
MSSPPPEQQQFVAMLEAGDYLLSQRALRDAKRDLMDHFGREPTESQIVEYVIDALVNQSLCLTRTLQGEPPGSGGEAWQLTDSRRIFIKLRFHELRFDEVVAYLQSCHKSAHA